MLCLQAGHQPSKGPCTDHDPTKTPAQATASAAAPGYRAMATSRETNLMPPASAFPAQELHPYGHRAHAASALRSTIDSTSDAVPRAISASTYGHSAHDQLPYGGYGQSTFNQSTYGQSGYGQPAYAQPAYGQHMSGRSSYGQPVNSARFPIDLTADESSDNAATSLTSSFAGQGSRYAYSYSTSSVQRPNFPNMVTDIYLRVDPEITVTPASMQMPTKVQEGVTELFESFPSCKNNNINGPDWFPKLKQQVPRAALKEKCLRYYSKKSGPSPWTAENAGKYACKTCTDSCLPCVLYDRTSQKFIVLPLHPDFKTASLPEHQGWWVSTLLESGIDMHLLAGNHADCRSDPLWWRCHACQRCVRLRHREEAQGRS